MNQDEDKLKRGVPESIWGKVWEQWKIGLCVFLTPLIILPLILCVLSLYFAAYQVTDESFSLILNIIAALLASVAGSGIWDKVKNIAGNTLLIKKGNSAVRNLSLARLKVKNISERTKTKASPEEIINLLGLLEKDVANSLQEWNDILPGVADIEVVYGLLSEKENELNTAIQEKEELDKRLAQEKQLQNGEKQELKKEIEGARKKVLELNQVVGRLQRQAVTTSPYTVYVEPSVIRFPFPSLEGSRNITLTTCSKCGKTYEIVNALADKGLCPDCSKA